VKTGRRLTLMPLALVTLTIASCALLLPVAAAAQPASNGPMQIERIQSGWLGAPEVKVTSVDGRTSPVIGAYGGWVADETILFGAGGYWLASGSGDREMGYGGFVVQFLGHSSGRVGFALKALLGGGEATLTDTVTQLIPPRITDVDLRNLPRNTPQSTIDQLIRNATPTLRTTNVRVHNGFFVAEPEANVTFRVSEHFRVAAGAGYRFIGDDYYSHNGHRLSGATGTVSVQIF
jgi:hypothetical protein